MRRKTKDLTIKTNIPLKPFVAPKISDKLKVTYKKSVVAPPAVASAKHLGGHRLEVVFTDGVCRKIDVAPFLKRFPHPSHNKYKKISEFKKFKIIDGNINWHDYNMIFEPESLYKGEIR